MYSDISSIVKLASMLGSGWEVRAGEPTGESRAGGRFERGVCGLPSRASVALTVGLVLADLLPRKCFSELGVLNIGAGTPEGA